MTFDKLMEFISHRMKMSHIYQPLMIMELLQNKGKRSALQIANSILACDQSQIEYYQRVVQKMVGRILSKHKIVYRDKQKKYILNGFENLTETQINELIAACKLKLNTYIKKRGEAMWQHRKLSAKSLPGTLRYNVLKKAAFHCELCGISAELKALEVDHIIPKNKGGSDNEDNLQALCYSCNAMKRDRDNTNFHAIRESFKQKSNNCLFCNLPNNRIIFENELAYAIRDAFPVTPLHSLIIPKRHVIDYFSLSRSELNACDTLIKQVRHSICEEDNSVTAFNIGMNAGKDAGQTIFHCHIHLIPRRKGDVDNPKGGVRHTIPGKGYY